MKMNHLLLEGYCDGEKGVDTYKCCGTLKMKSYCLECPQFSYTFCPSEIALSDEDGVVLDWIGFGGDMEPLDNEKQQEYVLLWNQICKEKIKESYDEFMKRMGNIKKSNK